MSISIYKIKYMCTYMQKKKQNPQHFTRGHKKDVNTGKAIQNYGQKDQRSQ